MVKAFDKVFNFSTENNRCVAIGGNTIGLSQC